MITSKDLQHTIDELQRAIEEEEENNNSLSDSLKGENGKPDVHYLLGFHRQTIKSAIGNLQRLIKQQKNNHDGYFFD